MKNYYAILGVHRNSTPFELKEARRKLAIQHHPDRGGSLDAMVEVNEAYSTLSNAEARRRYNILLGAKAHTCPTCEGKGVTRKQKGFTKSIVSACSECKGAGVLQ